MKYIKKVLLPFFPDNEWLRRHWWHRLVLVLISLVTILGSIFILINFYHLIENLKQAYIQVQGDSDTWAIQNGATLVSPTVYMNNAIGNLEGILAFLIFTYTVPSIIYRIVLFITIGNRWKNKELKK